MTALYAAPSEPVETRDYRAWLDAYVLDETGHLLFASILGTQIVVEAVWALLVHKQGLALDLANGVTLRRREHMHYRKVSARLPASNAVHLLLAATPATLDGAQQGEPAYLIAAGRGGDIPRFWAFWNRICPVPALEAWAPYLWAAGVSEGLVTPLEAYGCAAWRIRPAPQRWGEIITGGLKKGVIEWPRSSRR